MRGIRGTAKEALRAYGAGQGGCLGNRIDIARITNAVLGYAQMR